MLIAMVSHSPHLSGAERMLVNLAGGLAERDLATCLVMLSGDGPMRTLPMPRRCRIHPLRHPLTWYLTEWAPTASAEVYLRGLLPAAREIAAVLRETGADLVLVNTLTNAAGLIAAAALNLPVVTWVHGILDDYLLVGSEAPIKPLFDELLLRSSVAVASPSEWTSSHFREVFGVEVATIPNAFELPATVRPIPSGPPRFVCLNTFDNHKGHETLLKASHLLRLNGYDFAFHWYGDGTLRPRLQRLVERFDLGSVIAFKGRTTEVRSVYEGATALVTAARIEPFGMTLIEAMGHARPIVVSDTSGHREIVSKEVGFVCPIDDPAAFAEKMAWIIEHPAQAAAMGQAARAVAQEKFALDRLCRDFHDLFHRILERERCLTAAEVRDRYHLARSYLRRVA